VLRAGFARLDISTRAAGAQLVGYPRRSQRATGRHDPLFARAVVLEEGHSVTAICSVELCYVGEDVVAEARDRIARDTGIATDAVLLCATHTHSGPHDVDPSFWPYGLPERIAAVVHRARDRVGPARVGAGWGTLHGHSLNRRRLEDPVDPALLAVRIDDGDGVPLGIIWSFACHPVVLGPDNLLISGDWPGLAARALEQRLGAVVVFAQGACADVNPLTAGVRALLGRRPIGDRTGGTFAEAEHLATAAADEVLRVCGGIGTRPGAGVWTRRIRVDGDAAPAALEDRAAPAFGPGLPRPRSASTDPFEVMLVGLDSPGVVLVGQPGEAFAQTGVALRRELRALGIEHACVVGYANGWRGYLPPRDAFAEGGYEVGWARTVGVPVGLQDAIREAVVEAVASRGLSRSPAAPRGRAA
jgi:neutral/alkaline ceramidase-like enzyme